MPHFGIPSRGNTQGHIGQNGFPPLLVYMTLFLLYIYL